MGSDVSRGPSGVASLREPRFSRLHQDCGGRDVCRSCVLPFQQQLTLNGAFEDSTLPAPRVIDEKEELGVIVDKGVEDEDLLNSKESATKIRRSSKE